jgi:hypothetical protein
MNCERRASHRFLMHAKVEITGVDESGLQFAECSQVEDVGEAGCRLSVRGAVHEGSVLGLRPLGPEGENLVDEFPRLFVVIWVKRTNDRLQVGARSLREDELSDGGAQILHSPSHSSQK